VTHDIPVGSLKHDRAIRFGRELTRAMKARDVGARTVTDAIHCGRSTVRSWREGRILPRIETARHLAEALDWPRLADLGVELRTKRCPIDDRLFTDDSGSDNRIYCSDPCKRVAAQSVIGVPTRQRAGIAERRLRVHRDAVAAYCAGCEPSGRCVTPECELRPVSPLQLYETWIDIEAVRSRRRNRWEGTSEADAARQTAVWARYTPEERQARIDKAAEASRRGRGLVPA
jgi:hypothetical protein